jgi:hypothetical protein
MNEDVDRVAAAGECHGHRVDEEGHVVGDDLDDAVRRHPAVLFERRRVGVDLHLAGAPSLQEVPVGERRAVEVELADVLGRRVRVVRANERFDRTRHGFGQPLPGVRHSLFDERRLRFLRLDGHRALSPYASRRSMNRLRVRDGAPASGTVSGDNVRRFDKTVRGRDHRLARSD